MDDSNKPENQSPQGDPSAKKGLAGVSKKNPLFWVLIPFVLCIMGPWEGYKALSKRVYDDGDFGTLRHWIGVLSALGLGSAVGYFFGWQADASWYMSLSEGVGTAVLTYAYGWPLVYMGFGQWLGRLASTLWDAVERNENNGFSHFVMVLAGVGAVVAGITVFWTQWDAAAVSLANWGILKGPLSFIWGGVLGVLTVALGFGAIQMGMVAIALVSGVILGYFFGYPMADQFLAAHDWSKLAVFGKSIPMAWPLTAAMYLVYVAYVFPLVHVLGSFGLARLVEFFEAAFDAAYDTVVGKFDAVVVQLANLYMTYHLVLLTPLAVGLAGWQLGAWWMLAAQVFVGAFSYVLLGNVLKLAGNIAVSGVLALHAAWFTFAFMTGHHWSKGWSVGAAIVAAILWFYMAYPAIYWGVRSAVPRLLDNPLGRLLVLVHDKLGTIVRFIVKDATHITYTDNTWFARVVAQLANIGVAYLVYMFSVSFFGSLGWSFWATIAAQVAVVYASYALVGRFLNWSGNWTIGSVLALVAAVGAGMIAWGMLPFTFWWTMAASAGIGLAAGSLTFAYGYAIPYATLHKALVTFDAKVLPLGTAYIEPFFTGAHRLFWSPIARLATTYLRTYRSVRAALRPYFGNFAALWADAWKSVKEVWEQMTGRN